MVRDTFLWESSDTHGLPVVKDGLGALECRVVGWISLSGLGSGRGNRGEGGSGGGDGEQGGSSRGLALQTPGIGVSAGVEEGQSDGSTGSMLFLARVEHVIQRRETGPEGEGDRVKPLVYENQRYVTTEA
jgi:hypothetical protein